MTDCEGTEQVSICSSESSIVHERSVDAEEPIRPTSIQQNMGENYDNVPSARVSVCSTESLSVHERLVDGEQSSKSTTIQRIGEKVTVRKSVSFTVNERLVDGEVPANPIPIPNFRHQYYDPQPDSVSECSSVSLSLHEQFGHTEKQEQPRTLQNMRDAYDDAPPDRFKLVYITFLLNGGAIYLSWLFINFLSPTYYFDYWFSEGKFHIPTSYATRFMRALGMDACSPLFGATLINIIPIYGVPLLLRVGGSLLVNIINMLILLITACTMTPSFQDMGSFYNLTFVVLLIMMGTNGVYQSSLYGVAADFPAQYTNALMIGTYLGGIFASLVYIFCTAANPTTANPTAVAYFSIAFAYLLICSLSLVLSWRSEFFGYYAEKGDEARRQVPNGVRKFFADMGTVFKKAWAELLNIFIIFLVYYCIFPTLSIGIQPWPTPGMAHLPTYFMQIGTFLNFYTMATIGAVAACFIRVPESNGCLRCHLLLPTSFSIVFIPFFMYCNFIPNPPDHRTKSVVFKNEWFYFIGNGLLGLVVGYLTAILLMLVPKVVPPSVSRLAAQMGAFAMIMGLYFGAGMTAAFIAVLTS